MKMTDRPDIEAFAREGFSIELMIKTRRKLWQVRYEIVEAERAGATRETLQPQIDEVTHLEQILKGYAEEMALTLERILALLAY